MLDTSLSTRHSQAETPRADRRAARQRRLRHWLLHPVSQNIGIWLLAMTPFVLIGLSTNAGWEQVLDSIRKSLLPACLYFALPIYAHAFLIAPLFNRQRYVLYLALFIVNVTFWSATVFWLPPTWPIIRGMNFITHFTTVGTITFLAALIRIARDAVVRRQESRQAELQLLKDQLNPHFLFNTLNNLYGLAVLKSDRLPPLMLQLSDLLRYSLYETREALAPLERELEYIRNYVALENVRLADRTDVELDISDDGSGYRIAPLLLITFVENCFKHQRSAPGRRGFVAIHIGVSGHRLQLQTRNSCEPAPGADPKRHSGIGLANARRRLQILYPGRYRLHTEEKEGVFRLDLEVELL